MKLHRARGVLLVAALWAAPACVVGSATTGPQDLAPKLARSTFIEQGRLVALVVSTRPMRYRLERPYIPLEIAVVNQGLDSLTLTPESFLLTDRAGREYPVVGREELSRLYGNTDIDRNYAEALPFVLNKFSTYRRQRSNFTPDFDAPITRDRVALPRFSYVHDFLYFPRPEGDLVHEPLDLVISAPELTDRTFIRFQLTK